MNIVFNNVFVKKLKLTKFSKKKNRLKWTCNCSLANFYTLGKTNKTHHTQINGTILNNSYLYGDCAKAKSILLSLSICNIINYNL